MYNENLQCRCVLWLPGPSLAVQLIMYVFKVFNELASGILHYDYTYTVVKYTTQQILGSMQESQLGKKFLASSTMADLCQVFGREDDLEKRQVSYYHNDGADIMCACAFGSVS